MKTLGLAGIMMTAGAAGLSTVAASVSAAKVEATVWAGAGGGGQGGPESRPVMLLAAGGCEADIQNIAWVLTTDSYVDPKTRETIEHKVLLCYKVDRAGKMTDIVDVRDITWDAKLKPLPSTGRNDQYTPEKVRQQWEKLMKELDKEAGKDKEEKKNP